MAAVRKHLDQFFKSGKVPGKADIDSAMGESILKRRTWRDVKNYIHNYHNSTGKWVKKKSKKEMIGRIS